MATLLEVSELIRKNDTKIISNQDEQTDVLGSIDNNIQKFLELQKRSRLDDLEDRREQRRVIGTASVAGAAAAAGGGKGGGGFAPTILPGGGLLPTLGKGALAVGSAVTGFAIAKALGRYLKNQTAEALGTSRGQNLTESRALRQQLDLAKKNLATETKRLKTEIKRLKTDLDDARVRENRLIKEAESAKTNARATLKAEIEAAAAKRAQLETDLKNARANLAQVKADLADAKTTLKETKAAGKLKADALQAQVETLSGRVKTLSDNAAIRATQTYGGSPPPSVMRGDTVTYTNKAGKAGTGVATGVEVARGNVQVKTPNGSVVAIPKRNIVPGVPDSITNQTPGSMRGVNNTLRGASIISGDLVGTLEAAAAGTAKVTTGRVSALAGNISRILGSGTMLALTGIFGFSTSIGIGDSGFAEDTQYGSLAARIYAFIKAIQQNASVAQILKFKREAIAEAGDEFTLNLALTQDPPEGLGMSTEDAVQIKQLLFSSNPELGGALKQFYTDRNKAVQAGVEAFMADPKKVAVAKLQYKNNKRINSSISEADYLRNRALSYAADTVGLTGLARPEFTGNGFRPSFDLMTTGQKMQNILALSQGNFNQPSGGAGVNVGSISGDTNISNSSPQSIVVGDNHATDNGSSHDMNGSSGSSMTMQ